MLLMHVRHYTVTSPVASRLLNGAHQTQPPAPTFATRQICSSTLTAGSRLHFKLGSPRSAWHMCSPALLSPLLYPHALATATLRDMSFNMAFKQIVSMNAIHS